MHKANVAWYTMGSRKPLVMLFSGLVLNTLLAGLEALALKSSHYQRLDKFVLAKGRRLMQRAACKKSTEQGVTVYKALPNKEVWLWLRLVLQVLSGVSDDFGIGRTWPFPNYHKAILATVFGKCSFDRNDLLDSDGRVVVWHPSLRQFRDDLVADFFWFLRNLVKSLCKLIVVSYACNFLGVAIPPPGWRRFGP